MSGTFSSFGSALSAIRYNRVAMDVASGNVANANTEGYARRMAVAQAVGAPAVPALWSRWNGSAGGVELGSISRMVDPLLDSRSRLEQGSLSYLGARSASLVRFETTLGEPGDGGIAAALSAFKQGWHDVANNPSDEAARTQLLGRAGTLTATIQAQGRSVATEWSDQRARLDAAATEVNVVASDLAKLNDALRAAYVAETDAGALLDQRDQLTLRLAQLTGGLTTIEEDTTARVTVEGQTLVSGNTSVALTVSGAATMGGAATDPIAVRMAGVAVAVGGGELGAAQSLLTGDLPDYLAKLDAFVSELVNTTNSQHVLGKDLDEAGGSAFFSGTTAASLSVAVTDPRRVAAASLTGGRLDNSNATTLGNLDLGAEQYRMLVTKVGVDVASAERMTTNQAILADQVEVSRESLSGINIDEEMVNLLTAQRAYEAASRVMTTLDSVLDTLINRTGLTR